MAVGVSLPTAVTETIAGLLTGDTAQDAVTVSVPIDIVHTILAGLIPIANVPKDIELLIPLGVADAVGVRVPTVWVEAIPVGMIPMGIKGLPSSYWLPTIDLVETPRIEPWPRTWVTSTFPSGLEFLRASASTAARGSS